jgi:pimeloyl-ACP methyl ester carboxylesterase
VSATGTKATASNAMSLPLSPCCSAEDRSTSGTPSNISSVCSRISFDAAAGDTEDAAVSDLIKNTDNFVEVPGGYLYYRTRGQGQDVVLVNAGATDLRLWDSTVSWLSGIARVTTFDCRETGLSTPGEMPYSEIEDIAAVMDAAGVRSAVLLGVSDGARRVLAFAHRYPDRVDRAVAVGGTFGDFPNASPEEAAARQEMTAHFARREETLTREGIRAAVEMDLTAWSPALSQQERRRMIGIHVANPSMYTLEHYHGTELDPPVKGRFSEIDVPVAVLVGGRDFEGTRLWAKRIADQAPDATHTLLPEADHLPMLSTPQQFERFLRDVLRTGLASDADVRF